MNGSCSHSVFSSVDKERTEELLRAIQRKTVTLDTLRYNPLPPCSTPPAATTGKPHTEMQPHSHVYVQSYEKHFLMICAHLFLGDSSSAPGLCQSNGRLYPDSPSPSPPYLQKPKHHHNDTFKPLADSQVARLPPPLASHYEKVEFMEAQPNRKLQGLQNGVVALPQKKEHNPVQNGRNRPWERFTPEAFAQHFHQAVLKSTHNTLQNKGQPLTPIGAQPLGLIRSWKMTAVCHLVVFT